MNAQDWSGLLDEFGVRLLRAMGYAPEHLSGDHNPIIRALAQGDFVAKYGEMPGFNMRAVSKVATICQMMVYEWSNGPENDGKRKALRRHWYSWYKTRFAQPFSEQLGEDVQSDKWGLNWAGRLSETYGIFVDQMGVTYRDLWVEDASRMMETVYTTLFENSNILIAVEKDSLFADFLPVAKALGATAVYSGKGKSSKAAMEKLLRESFSWSEYSDPFTHYNPLVVLSISDYDFDGEAVIGPTFAEQARRYTRHVVEARVGIQPEQPEESLEDIWYQVKLSNSGYERWAEDKALFLAECENCGRKWPVVGGGNLWGHECYCGGAALTIRVGKKGQPAFGLEVEAMATRDYYRLVAEALLTVMPYDTIIDELRDACNADSWKAATEASEKVFQSNESYQELLDVFSRLEAIKRDFEWETQARMRHMGEPLVGNWRDLEDTPDVEEFIAHVEDGSYQPFRPFSQELRTARLTNRIWYAGKPVVDALIEKDLGWEQVLAD